MNILTVKVSCGIVLASILLQFIPRPQTQKAAKEPHLQALLPDSFPGWEVDILELGNTEAVTEATNKILQFDDHAFIGYQGAGKAFEVYAAYWGPGKMPVQLVGVHSPDRCWVENGWVCTDAKFAQDYSFPGIRLKPAEARTFTLDNQPRHVLFWHLVDGMVASGRKKVTTAPNVARWLEGFWKHLWVDEPEQYFIRISSEYPLERLKHEPIFLETIERLGSIGLANSNPSP